VIKEISDHGAGFKSLKDVWADTTSAFADDELNEASCSHIFYIVEHDSALRQRRRRPRAKMPALKKPRLERFSQLLASGKTVTAAYVEAGYKCPVIVAPD
jgi:hypothetical protein